MQIIKPDHELDTALDDLQYKYIRLEALISIMQQFTAECVDVVGARKNAVSDSMYEIELGIHEANEKLADILCKGRIVRKEVSAQEEAE